MTDTVNPNTIDYYVLQHLQQNQGVTTYDFYKLGIITPANAVGRLREKGFPISTTPVVVEDEHGITHKRVALYQLLNEDQGGAIDE